MHTRSIYAKLNVGSRAKAILQAQKINPLKSQPPEYHLSGDEIRLWVDDSTTARRLYYSHPQSKRIHEDTTQIGFVITYLDP